MENVKEMWQRIEAAYAKAVTEDDKAKAIALQHEIQDGMSAEELREFNDLLLADTHDLLAEGDAMVAEGIKEKLGELPEALSLAYIAKNYFGKSNSWLSQRLNGSLVNGKRARFSATEVRVLQDALHDIGHKLLAVAF